MKSITSIRRVNHAAWAPLGRFKLLLLCSLVSALASVFAFTASAQGTAFTHQGRLDVGGLPATGAYDFKFDVFYAAAPGGTVVAPANIISNVPVQGGLFTVRLDFGSSIFAGPSRWMEMGVRPSGSGGAYTTLSPRQELTPAPYAIFAARSGAVAASSVGTAGLANEAVTSAKIADETIDADDLSPSVLRNTFWRLTGNGGTTAGVNFLGTTDNQPVEIKVNNRRMLRLEPADNVIAGQFDNQVTPGFSWATISGGQEHLISADFGTISGGSGHMIQSGAFSGVIAGGHLNRLSSGAHNSVISGGAFHVNQGTFGVIGGGEFNTNISSFGVISGGILNLNSGESATISGGRGNTVRSGSAYAVIGGGEGHAISTNGTYSTIGGGNFNAILANADFATVPGGRLNVAGGDYSLAAGRRAKAYHQGSFVWADSTDADFPSTGANQFLIRAAGGVGIGTTSPTDMLDVEGTVRINDHDLYLRGSTDGNHGLGYRGNYAGQNVDGPALFGWDGGILGTTGTGENWSLRWSSSGQVFTRGAINPPSDRNMKDNFTPVDTSAVLEKVVAMPITRWNYKGDPATPHIGPVAQDFHAAFGIGTDEKHIATVDADGVALAAIQGLNQKVEDQRRQMAAKDDRVAALEETVKQLQSTLEQLVRGKNGGVR